MWWLIDMMLGFMYMFFLTRKPSLILLLLSLLSQKSSLPAEFIQIEKRPWRNAVASDRKMTQRPIKEINSEILLKTLVNIGNDQFYILKQNFCVSCIK